MNILLPWQSEGRLEHVRCSVKPSKLIMGIVWEHRSSYYKNQDFSYVVYGYWGNHNKSVRRGIAQSLQEAKDIVDETLIKTGWFPLKDNDKLLTLL